MKRSVRYFLLGVLVLNLSAVGVVLLGQLPQAVASTAKETGETEIAPDKEALLLLGRELAAKTEELQRREAELDELLRSDEVQRRVKQMAQEKEPEPPQPVVEVDPEPDADALAFERLSRAYENMDPESAAAALARLAKIDQEAVVQLLTTWKPRTSGSILDALAQSNPEIAADLSYEIWKRGGKNRPQSANADLPADSTEP